MQGLLNTGGLVGSSLITRRSVTVADPVLSTLGGVTVGAAARLLTGLNNNDAVSTFTNTAPSSVTMTQTGTQRPLYTANFINTLPVLTFDGTDDRFVVNSLPFDAGNSSFTVYTVFRAGTSAGTRNVFRLGGASTRRGIGLNIPSGGSVLVRFEVTGDVLDVNCTSATNQTWLIAAMRYDANTLTLSGDVYGTRTGSGTRVLAGTPNWDTAMAYNSIGQGSTGVAMLGGQLAELWIYNQFHSNTQRDSAISRFRTLYNLP